MNHKEIDYTRLDEMMCSLGFETVHSKSNGVYKNAYLSYLSGHRLDLSATDQEPLTVLRELYRFIFELGMAEGVRIHQQDMRSLLGITE